MESSYYDRFPSRLHLPGDIWQGLPTHGILPQPSCCGIIITPACDLSNRKVDTLTYLPVIPVGIYLQMFHLVSKYVGLIRTLCEQIKVVSFSHDVNNPELELAIIEFAHKLSQQHDQIQGKNADVVVRLQHLIDLVIGSLRGESLPDCAAKVKSALGEKEHKKITKEIITNSFRTDIHFLPSDSQDPDYATLSKHAVCLFRYPLSIPLEVLDYANDPSVTDWPGATGHLQRRFPCVKNMLDNRPMKGLRLHKSITADLLTRFTGLYSRLGSPDLSPVTVDRITNELVG